MAVDFYHKDYEIGCGGTETPIQYEGKTYLYVWSKIDKRHFYYVKPDDLFIEDNEAPWIARENMAKTEREQRQLKAKFLASHKRLTNYYDIIEGGHECALDGYTLGQVAAVHTYDGGLYITERGEPDKVQALTRGGGKSWAYLATAPFELTLCRDSWNAPTLDELESKLFEFWKSEVRSEDEKTYADMMMSPEKYSREELTQFLQDNDRNGCYTDELAESEGANPMTKKECMKLVRNANGGGE